MIALKSRRSPPRRDCESRSGRRYEGQTYQSAGLERVVSRPSELDAVIRSALRKWDKTIKTLGITTEV
jgi:hypothetical protein